MPAMEHPDIPKNLSLPASSCLCPKRCQGDCAVTVLPPHLLLQSPAQRGWVKRTGTWLLPRCLCPGDSPRGTPRALPGWGPRAGCLPAKHPCGPKDRSSRAASLKRGKCVTSSRPGQGSSNRTAPLAHPVCREPGVRQLYPGGSHAAGAGVGQHTGLGQEQARPQRREAVPPPTPAPASEREAQAQPSCPVSGRKGKGAELCSAVPASTGGTNLMIKQDRTFHPKKLFCFFCCNVGQVLPQRLWSPQLGSSASTGCAGELR